MLFLCHLYCHTLNIVLPVKLHRNISNFYNNQHGLKFLHLNIRSIRGKLAKLNILVSQWPNLHILAFTETWLNNIIADGDSWFPGHSINRSDWINWSGVGLAFMSMTICLLLGEWICKWNFQVCVRGWKYFYRIQKEFYLSLSFVVHHSLTSWTRFKRYLTMLVLRIRKC